MLGPIYPFLSGPVVFKECFQVSERFTPAQRAYLLQEICLMNGDESIICYIDELCVFKVVFVVSCVKSHSQGGWTL